MKKINFVFLLVVIISGCASTLHTPATFEKASIPLSTYPAEGKVFVQKYERNLRNIFKNIRNTYSYKEMEFSQKNGLGFVKLAKTNMDGIYLNIALGTSKVIFTYKTDFNKGAIDVINSYINRLLKIAMKEKNVFEDSKVSGVRIALAWEARDLQKADFHHKGQYESVSVFIDKENCKKYLDQKISLQDMINKSFLIGYQNGVEIAQLNLVFNIQKVNKESNSSDSSSNKTYVGSGISYKVGDAIIGFEYNDILKDTIDREFSIWAGRTRDDYIVFSAETGLGEATIYLWNAKSTKTKLEKAVSKAIEWSDVARINQADTTRDLGCFSERHKESMFCNNPGEMKLTFFATKGGKQTYLIVDIIDGNNQFIKASLYFKLSEMKKLLNHIKEIENVLQKAKDNESKQDLFK